MEYQSYDLTKRFEGLRLEAYKCPAGIWTIGYGHTKGVKKGDKITKEQAEAFLREDMKESEAAVKKLVKVALTQGQYDALVDFTFNLGEGNLSRSTLLKLLNQGDYAGAWLEFRKWNKARDPETGQMVPVKGLTVRRMAESDIFKSG